MSQTYSNMVTLTQIDRFQFDAYFEGSNVNVILDEPEPVGKNAGPSPEQLLCAAVANCLSDALFFSVNKFGNDPSPIVSKTQAEIVRNAEKRMRIACINVEISLGKAHDQLTNVKRALEQFRSFCTVASSVSQAIPVKIKVSDSNGVILLDEIESHEQEVASTCNIGDKSCSCCSGE